MSVLGAFSNVLQERGMLVEYTLGEVPLVLSFLFNPSTITRTQSLQVAHGGAPGARGGYGFQNRAETQRAAQGVSAEPETLSFRILLDATDRMDRGDPVASTYGVQPEIDTIRTMLQPRNRAPEGARTLTALGAGDRKAFARSEHPAVLLFKWGVEVLPVFMTQAQIEAKECLPSLHPYRAEASLSLRILEGDNPFTEIERRRRLASAEGLAGVAAALADLTRIG